MTCRSIFAFTLVELLIVVFILGLLAAVVVSQFGTTSLEAREAALMSNLTILRKAIGLYIVQHNNNYPNGNTNDVVNQLTGKTDIDGNPGIEFGPYLRNDIPRNPINNLDTIKIVKLPQGPDDKEGWYYDEDTGEIRANSSGTSLSGIDYIDL